MVVVNLEGVKVGFENLPDGVYPARLIKTTFKPNKTNPGHDNIVTEWTFREDCPEEVAGRKAFVQLPTTPKGLGITKGALINMGIDPEQLEGPVDMDEMFTDLAGTEAFIKVTKQVYQGEERDRYAIVAEPDGWTG